MGLEGVHFHRYADESQARFQRHLLLVGANHLTCSLTMREALLHRATYARIRKAGGPRPPWEDLLLLTTCNRIELYAVTRFSEETGRAICEVLDQPRHSRSLYVLEDDEAAEHLLRVASGLDSLAQGESQVDRKSTRLNSSHIQKSRMPSSA